LCAGGFASAMCSVGGGPLTLRGVPNPQVFAQGGADTFNVTGLPGGMRADLYGGSQNDTFLVGATSNGMAAVKGGLFVYGEGGTDSLALHEPGPKVGATYTPDPFSLTRQGSTGDPAHTGFFMFETVKVDGTEKDDFFQVNGTPAGVPLTLAGNGGNDTLTGPSLTTTWDISGPNQGSLQA